MLANSTIINRAGFVIILLIFVFLSGCTSNDDQVQSTSKKYTIDEKDIVYCINNCPHDHPELNCQWMLKDSLKHMKNYSLAVDGNND